MLYYHKELKVIYKSDYQIQKAIKEDSLFKIEEGLYSDKKNADFIEIINKKYPNYVLCGDSAYYYHDLTDFIPVYFELATKKNEKIRSKHIKQIRLTDDLFELGIIDIDINGIKAKIYDKERMLIELVRRKKQMGYDMYKEIIKNYRSQIDYLDIEKIEKYLTHFYHSDRLFQMIQDEVF